MSFYHSIFQSCTMRSRHFFSRIFRSLTRIGSFQHYQDYFEELYQISINNPAVVYRNRVVLRLLQSKICHFCLLMLFFPNLDDTLRILNYEYSYFSERSLSRILLWVMVMLHACYTQQNYWLRPNSRLIVLNLEYLFYNRIPQECRLLNHKLMRLYARFMFSTQRPAFLAIVCMMLLV